MRDRPLPQLTIQQLDYLVAVDDHDTWAEAAASLGVTPSALSQGLAELERRLGLKLFERVGRRRVIAASRLPVVTYARDALAQTDDLAHWIERARSGTTSTLRAGMIDAAAIGHYGQTLRQFRETNPGVDFTLTVAPSGELIDLVARGALDFVVVVRPPIPSSDLHWIDALTEPLGVYGPPGAEGGPSDWGPWVSFNSSSHTRQLIANALGEVGARFDVVAESNQPEVLKEMVRLGLGWTVLPVIQAESPPDPLTPASEEPLSTRTLAIARRKKALDHPLAEELIESLLKI